LLRADDDAMLIPRFSIRWVLAFTAVCAVLFLFARAAWQGQHWSGAIVLGIAFLAVTLLVHAALFAAIWAISLVYPNLPMRSQLPDGATRTPIAIDPTAPAVAQFPPGETNSAGEAP
jgi:asparagine N-glycosylation enzyme membrane subunit Stt3